MREDSTWSLVQQSVWAWPRGPCVAWPHSSCRNIRQSFPMYICPTSAKLPSSCLLSRAQAWHAWGLVVGTWKVYDFGGVFFLLCTRTFFFFQLNIQVQVIWNCKCSLNLEFKHHAAAEKILHFRVAAFRIHRSKISHLGACGLHFLSLRRSLSRRKRLHFPFIHSLIDFYFEPESYSVV